jgi:hypothetical protein
MKRDLLTAMSLLALCSCHQLSAGEQQCRSAALSGSAREHGVLTVTKMERLTRNQFSDLLVENRKKDGIREDDARKDLPNYLPAKESHLTKEPWTYLAIQVGFERAGRPAESQTYACYGATGECQCVVRGWKGEHPWGWDKP